MSYEGDMLAMISSEVSRVADALERPTITWLPLPQGAKTTLASFTDALALKITETDEDTYIHVLLGDGTVQKLGGKDGIDVFVYQAGGA